MVSFLRTRFLFRVLRLCTGNVLLKRRYLWEILYLDLFNSCTGLRLLKPVRDSVWILYLIIVESHIETWQLWTWQLWTGEIITAITLSMCMWWHKCHVRHRVSERIQSLLKAWLCFAFWFGVLHISRKYNTSISDCSLQSELHVFVVPFRANCTRWKGARTDEQIKTPMLAVLWSHRSQRFALPVCCLHFGRKFASEHYCTCLNLFSNIWLQFED